ncbi:MAG: hypothetical protein PVF83_07825 [Anaerolineales bacterium]|jgi:hypothetical protein
MADTTNRKLLHSSESIYQRLLSAYPAAHRREYGGLMAQLFRDLCRDSVNKKGISGLFGLWRCVLVDIVSTAAIEHFHLWEEGVQMMTKKQHIRILTLTGLPIGLGLFLWLINRPFMGHMLSANDAQPLGWIMTAVVFVLAGLAYYFQRKIILLDNSKKRIVFFVCNSLFVVLPATLLVFLGPALIVLKQSGLNP